MKETVFIDAQNGGIGVFIGAGNQVGLQRLLRCLHIFLIPKKILVK